MGYSLELFVHRDVIDGLICVICQDVLERPVVLQECEHLFCKDCIENWMITSRTCPTDRTPISESALLQAPRFLRNMLDALELKCTAEECDTIVKLGNLEGHLAKCVWSPKQCQYSCGTQLTQEQISSHNCSKYLSDQLRAKNQECEMLKATCQHQSAEIVRMQTAELIEQQKMQNLKETIQMKNDEIKSLKATIEKKNEEIQSLKATLPNKHVINSPISTIKSSFTKVFMEIAADDVLSGKVIFELRTDLAPKASELFRILCTGEKGCSYKHSTLTTFSTGAYLVWDNGPIKESNFSILPDSSNLPYKRGGSIYFTNGSPNDRVGPKFVVATNATADLAIFERLVAFGSVVDGFDVVKSIASLNSHSFAPFRSKKIVITNCGQLS